jgi:hypothetical protein
MARLLIRLKKHRDRTNTLHCEREDGSATWSRRKGDWFALHDLTHFAAEMRLTLDSAFYGTVASGWGIEDFGTPWPRGPLPPQAVFAESIVGSLDLERAGQAVQSASELAARAGALSRESAPTLTDDALTEIREQLAELYLRWHTLPAGEQLELHFE